MSNRILTFSQAKLNYDAYKKLTIPDTLECMTKNDVSTYIYADMTLLTNYANNQLVPSIRVVGELTDYSSYCYFFNDKVNDIAVQSDGKIIVVGKFTKYKGVESNRIIRLNTNGSIDTTFSIGTGLSNALGTSYGTEGRVVKIQSDGKILVGGCFDNYNGTTRYSILRLNSNGSLDTSFDAGLVFSSNSSAMICNDILLIGSDIYACGYALYSDSTYTGRSYTETCKLSSTGSLDTTFFTNNQYGSNARPLITANSIVTDGTNLYVGGEVGGTSYYSLNVKKMSTSGVVDETFSVASPLQYVTKLFYRSSDSSILYGGPTLKKMSITGAADSTFNNNFSSSSYPFLAIDDIKIDSTGKILLAASSLPC